MVTVKNKIPIIVSCTRSISRKAGYKSRKVSIPRKIKFNFITPPANWFEKFVSKIKGLFK